MSQTTELLLRIKQQGGEQLTRLSSSFKNLGQQAAAANINFKEISDELKKIQQTSTNSVNNLKGYANAWREIANSVEIGTAEFKQANAEAAKLEAQLRKVQPGGRGRLAAGAQIAGTIAGAGVFGGLEGAAGAGIGAIVGGVPGAITGGAIGAQVGMFRQGLGDVATYAADLNKQRQALRLVTKDSFEYQRALSFIIQTSRDLAIPQEIITRQFTQLTASVKGAGGNVRDAEKAFIGIASGIRGTGGSLDQLDSALTATSQVFSKGKVSAEELRQQIGERLPGAFSLFAKSLDMTPQELDKALEKGQVSLKDFQLFAERLFLEYGESAKILADGPDAAGDRLKTQLAELKSAIGPILKDMGASFQNFASEAIKAFLNLGRELGRFGRFMEEKFAGRLLDNAIKNVKAQDAIIKRFETESLVRVGGLSKQEKSQLSLARALRAGSMRIIQGAKAGPAAPAAEQPSDLPGITSQIGGESPRTKQAKKIVDLTKEELTLLKEIKRLEDAGLDIQAAAQRFRLDELQVSLQLERNKIGNNQAIAESLKNQRTLAKAVEAAFQGYGNELIKGFETQKEINRVLQDAEIKSGKITEEEAKRLLITRQIEEFIARFPLATEQQIARLRAALEQTKKAKSFVEDFKTSFKAVADAALDLGNNLGSTLGNAFAGLGDQLAEFVTTGKASFADFTRSVLADLAKIFARAAIFAGLKAIFQGSGIGNFLGFAMGGVMTENGPMPLKRYASGGIANSPQIAMFGEGSRPEAYVPLPDGRSIPVTMSGQGGGVNVVVNVDAKGSDVQGNGSQANALGVAVSSAVKAEIIRQQRPGGLLAGTR